MNSKRFLGRWLPEDAKKALKWVRHPAYREKCRLTRMPRYTAGATRLFNRQIEFIDACTYLQMHEELFQRQLYRFATQTEHPLIIDGGANIGMSVLYFKQMYPKSRVIAFEADPSIYQVLKRNVATYDLHGVELISKAIWTCDTELEFQQEGSLAGRVTTAPCASKTVKVPACRLHAYLRDKVDMLKLDIEGAETEVLLDCGDNLRNVENILVEHHSFVGQQQTLHAVINLLHDVGFRLYIEPAVQAQQPLLDRPNICGMELQLNIFGFRQKHS